MRKIALFSLLSNLSLHAESLAENLKVDESMPWMFPWLIGALLIVGLFFWAMYKMMKTKNPKYGYIILLATLLMVGILFI